MSILMTERTEKLHNLTKRSKEAGFTLIEVMVVVSIIAILMAIALPSYQESVRKARRSDAMSALMDAANRQEQAMLDRNAYTTNMTQLGFASDPMISPEGFYSIDATIGVNSYTLTATPVITEAQNDDTRCTWFALTSTGAKTAGGTQAAQCWGQ